MSSLEDMPFGCDMVADSIVSDSHLVRIYQLDIPKEPLNTIKAYNYYFLKQCPFFLFAVSKYLFEILIPKRDK